MENSLLLYKLQGEEILQFPTEEMQAEIHAFDYECKRMGTAPTITAKLAYPTCLDELWNDDVFVEFNGERYYIANTPSSSYSNESIMYTHEITFVSERKALETTYFKDGLLTEFQFFGDLQMFASRLNGFMETTDLGYECVVDDGVDTEELLITIDEKYIKEVLDYAFERYDVTYYFVGKTIHFGYYEHEIEDVLSYGRDNELLSIKRENSTDKLVDRISGAGSSENIPYYYPNFNESGDHETECNPTSLEGTFDINYAKLDNYTNLRDGGVVTFRKASGPDGELDYTIHVVENYVMRINGNYASDDCKFVGNFDEHATFTYPNAHFNSVTQIFFSCPSDGLVSFDMSHNKYVIGDILNPIRDNVGTIQNRTCSFVNTTTSANVPFTFSNDVFAANITSGNYRLTITDNVIWNGLSQDTETTDLKVWYVFDFMPTYNNVLGITYSFNGFENRAYHVNDYSFHRDFQRNITQPLSCTAQITMKFLLQRYTKVYFGTRMQSKHSYGNWHEFSPDRIYVRDSHNVDVDFDISSNGMVSFRSGEDIDFYDVTLRIPISLSLARVNIGGEWFYIPAEGVSFKYTSNLNRISVPYNHIEFDDNNRKVKCRVCGIYFDDEEAVPDGATITFSETQNWIAPKPNLMPSLYRDSLGEECFYDAINDTYYDEEGDFYEFVNPRDGNPKEHIEKNEDIKPTIVGVKNADGDDINIFTAFAYDNDDNNEWETQGDNRILTHSYFFGKLRKFDGVNGFNLFQQAIESGEMTVTMTSGTCGSCNFVIGVNDDGENTVQVDDDGNLLRDANGNVKFGSPQERQQDTMNYEVWVALRKDENSYGVILPDTEQNVIPIANQDTFVLTNILLPNAYILSAEKKLEYYLLDYMREHNVEKFNYGINFSRIYLAENQELLQYLNENSLIHVEYNGIVSDLYVSSFKYSVSSDDILPKITIELERKLVKRENIIDRIARTTRNSVSNYITNVTQKPNVSYDAAGGLKAVRLTFAEYQTIARHDTDTLYFITDKGVFYNGDEPFVGIKDVVIADGGTSLTLVDSLGFDHDFMVENYYHTPAYNNGLPIGIGNGIGDLNVPFMVGATSTQGGSSGLVPAPTSAQRERFLRGDGQWVEIGGGQSEIQYVKWALQSDFTLTTTNENQIGSFVLTKGLWWVSFKVQLKAAYAGMTSVFVSDGNKVQYVQSTVTCPHTTTSGTPTYSYFPVHGSGFVELPSASTLYIKVKPEYTASNASRRDSVVAVSDFGQPEVVTNLFALKLD